MSCLFKSATLITLGPATVERGDLRVKGGRISARAPQLEPLPDDQIIDASGKLLMPAMVCAHTHLYSALARGMPAPPRVPADFKQILEFIWWRLDRALDEDTIYWSALAAAIEAARAGAGCLFDHHASPSRIPGSLQIVREALERVGLRGALCYEVTDRGGQNLRDEGLEENRAFLKSTAQPLAQTAATGEQREAESDPPMFRGLVGAHASFTLADDSLAACAELMREFGAGLHIHVAEDLCDVEDARAKYGMSIIERLANHDALNERTILAHATHLSEKDFQIARGAGVWFAHNPRSNMNNQVGYAPVTKFGERVALGTDGIGADMFEEARFAFFKARDARASLSAETWLQSLANNQRLASTIFGADFGALKAGCAADLLALDYHSPTPLTAENLAWHLVFGFNSASVDGLMVNGKFIVKDKRLCFDDEAIYDDIRRASEKLWAKMKEL